MTLRLPSPRGSGNRPAASHSCWNSTTPANGKRYLSKNNIGTVGKHDYFRKNKSSSSIPILCGVDVSFTSINLHLLAMFTQFYEGRCFLCKYKSSSSCTFSPILCGVDISFASINKPITSRTKYHNNKTKALTNYIFCFPTISSPYIL